MTDKFARKECLTALRQHPELITRDDVIDQVCLTAAEIHNLGKGVSDDKAQFIIDRIRNYLESVTLLSIGDSAKLKRANSFTDEDLVGMAHGDSPVSNAYRELLVFRCNATVVPGGYVLVPVEPTEEMMLHNSECTHHAWDDPDCPMRETRRKVWRNMLAGAAQKSLHMKPEGDKDDA